MIVTEALDFVESEVMRGFLQTKELKNMNSYLTLICAAPVSLKKKAEAFAQIAKNYDFGSVNNPAQELADGIKRIMKELSCPRDGSIFTLSYVDREPPCEERPSSKSGREQPVVIPVSHYTTFKHISEEIRRRRNSFYGQLNCYIYNYGFGDYKWAHVAQFSPVTQEDIDADLKDHHYPRRYSKGLLLKRMDLILNGRAEVMYADNELEYMGDSNFYNADVAARQAMDKIDYGPFPKLSGDSGLWLPTPFEAGDLLTLDERPFRSENYAVMLNDRFCIYKDINDNSGDEIFLVTDINKCRRSYENPYAKNKRPKHTYFYDKCYYPSFNPLLRVSYFTKARPRNWDLWQISEAIKKKPELAELVLSRDNKTGWPQKLWDSTLSEILQEA